MESMKVSVGSGEWRERKEYRVNIPPNMNATVPHLLTVTIDAPSQTIAIVITDGADRTDIATIVIGVAGSY